MKCQNTEVNTKTPFRNSKIDVSHDMFIKILQDFVNDEWGIECEVSDLLNGLLDSVGQAISSKYQGINGWDRFKKDLIIHLVVNL